MFDTEAVAKVTTGTLQNRRVVVTRRPRKKVSGASKKSTGSETMTLRLFIFLAGILGYLHICQSADDNGHTLNLSGQGFLTILLSFRDSVSRFLSLLIR
jgi:hypothetical protein